MTIRQLLLPQKGERWFASMALVAATVINALMIYKYYDRFTLGGKLGFWGLFNDRFMVSGYDVLTYISLSNWKLYHVIYRHPLLAPILYPLSALNKCIMDETRFNAAVFIYAAVLIICSFYTALMLMRIMRDMAGVGKGNAMMLTALFFSFAHIMLTSMVPDHFAISLCLLVTTLYIAGMSMKGQYQWGRWQMMAMMTITAGVTLTNGVKTVIAGLFTMGRRYLSPHVWMVTVVMPVILLLAAYMAQHLWIEVPQNEKTRQNIEHKMKADKKFAAKINRQKEWDKEHLGKPIGDNNMLKWTDTSSSRIDAIVENLWGESIQVHRRYLLQDVNRNRPVIVTYGWWGNYAVEIVMAILFIGGIVAGWRHRFFRLCLSWFAFDMVLHLVLGFGIIEVYIMSGHWLFVVPIAIAYLIAHAAPKWRQWIVMTTFMLTIFLWTYNGWNIARYMLNMPT